jgi:hypothetical protein
MNFISKSILTLRVSSRRPAYTNVSGGEYVDPNYMNCFDVFEKSLSRVHASSVEARPLVSPQQMKRATRDWPWTQLVEIRDSVQATRQ